MTRGSPVSPSRGSDSGAGARGRLGRPFAALWAATAASNAADGVAVVLLPLIALRLTDSPGAVAAVTVAGTAAWPLLGLPAGLLVDRLERRRVLLCANATRAVVLAAVAAAWATDALSLPLLYGAAAVLGAAETVADTSLTSMVPAVVAPPGRGQANARIETTSNLLNNLAGPPAAGLLLAGGVAAAAGATSLAYAAALGAVVLLPSGRQAGGADDMPRAGPRRELTAGLRAIWSDEVLRRLTLLTAGMNVVWGAWTALFVVYAVAPGPLGLSAAQYGLLLTAMAVGGLAVAPCVDPLARRLGVRLLLALDLLGTVALVGPPAAGLGLAAVAAGAVAAGAGSAAWRAVVATIRHNRVEDRLLGRVYAASRVVSWGALPVGAAAAGALGQAHGVRAAFVAASLLALTLLVGFPRLTRALDLTAAYRGAATPQP